VAEKIAVIDGLKECEAVVFCYVAGEIEGLDDFFGDASSTPSCRLRNSLMHFQHSSRQYSKADSTLKCNDVMTRV